MAGDGYRPALVRQGKRLLVWLVGLAVLVVAARVAFYGTLV